MLYSEYLLVRLNDNTCLIYDSESPSLIEGRYESDSSYNRCPKCSFSIYDEFSDKLKYCDINILGSECIIGNKGSFVYRKYRNLSLFSCVLILCNYGIY